MIVIILIILFCGALAQMEVRRISVPTTRSTLTKINWIGCAMALFSLALQAWAQGYFPGYIETTIKEGFTSSQNVDPEAVQKKIELVVWNTFSIQVLLLISWWIGLLYIGWTSFKHQRAQKQQRAEKM